MAFEQKRSIIGLLYTLIHTYKFICIIITASKQKQPTILQLSERFFDEDGTISFHLLSLIELRENGYG